MFIAERHALVTKAPEGRHVQFGLQYGNIDFAQITHKHQQVMYLRITQHYIRLISLKLVTTHA